MFKNAIASSSKLVPRWVGTVEPSAAAAFSSRICLGHSRAHFGSAATLSASASPSNPPNGTAASDPLAPLASSSSSSSSRSPRQPSFRGSAGPVERVMPSITSLTPPTPSPAAASLPSSLSMRSAPTGPAMRWDPTPLIDDIPTTHTLTVTSTRNNLLLTLSDRQGPLFGTISAGTGKTFKNSQRSGFEAAHQASLKMFDKLLELARWTPVSRTAGGGLKLRVAYKGYSGQGAEAFSQALGGNEGGEVRRLVVKVEDRTGIKIGGTRPRRARRL